MSFALTLGMLTHRHVEQHAPGQTCPGCEMDSCPACGWLGPLGEPHTCTTDGQEATE